MSYDFQTSTHGKWILVGEHAVLRGYPALVFPVHEKTLTLSYHASNQALNIECTGEQQDEMRPLLLGALEEGMRMLQLPFKDVRGQFVLQNSIPIGSGMGASAALCVAVARWFASSNRLSHNTDLLHFAQQLEHVFHGKSSGVDIAGAQASSGVYFQQGQHSPIQQAWQPRWYLSFCKEVGLTSHCIQQVQFLWEKDATSAQNIDKKMSESVALAVIALQEKRPQSQTMLAQAMQSAHECFSEWGLISACLKTHMQCLREAGAIAVKPTGSGGGGYVVSLWDKPPPQMDSQLIRI